MRLIATLFVLASYASLSQAGEMLLFNCEGKETGKIKGFIAKEQLLLDCTGDTCTTKLGNNKFEAKKTEDGKYYSFAPSYFEFDPISGEAQGVAGEPYYYFTGICK